MSKKIYIFILSTALMHTNKVNSQDFHFSQFGEAPQLINPSLTGVSSVLKASVIYRDQWRTVTVPYKTYGFSLESRLKTSSWEQVDGKSMTFTKKSFNRFAGGLSFYSDKAGDGNLRTTQFNVNLATFVPLNKESNLSLGLQGSVVQRKIDFSNLVFSNQYNGTGYDASMANGENSKSFSFIYPDLGAGINWNYTGSEKLIVANRQKKANIGLAIFHINRPKQSYLVSSTPKIGFKYVFHGDFAIGLPHTNVAIAPSFLIQLQNTSHEIIAGTAVKYYIKENSKYTGIIQRTSVGFGAYYRYGDAVIFSFSYDKKQQYGIGISYDMNISGLTKVSKLSGGPEITLRYNTGNAFLYQKKAKPD
jgi:type IX secretion system PorP/SprF family membrane protein